MLPNPKNQGRSLVGLREMLLAIVISFHNIEKNFFQVVLLPSELDHSRGGLRQYYPQQITLCRGLIRYTYAPGDVSIDRHFSQAGDPRLGAYRSADIFAVAFHLQLIGYSARAHERSEEHT